MNKQKNEINGYAMIVIFLYGFGHLLLDASLILIPWDWKYLMGYLLLKILTILSLISYSYKLDKNI